MPARTEAISRSQTSGQSARRDRTSRDRRARSHANGATAPTIAATRASATTWVSSQAIAVSDDRACRRMLRPAPREAPA